MDKLRSQLDDDARTQQRQLDASQAALQTLREELDSARAAQSGLQVQEEREAEDEHGPDSWRSQYRQLQEQYDQLLAAHSQSSQELQRARADLASARQLDGREHKDECVEAKDRPPTPAAALVAQLRDGTGTGHIRGRPLVRPALRRLPRCRSGRGGEAGPTPSRARRRR